MKRFIVFIIVLFTILFTACKIKTENNDITLSGSSIEAINTENSIEKPDLNLISIGKVDTIEFGIGEKAGNILKSWGEPDFKGDFMGGSYISYDNITFFIDKYIDEMENGKVIRIGISESYELFGVKVGMRFEEIKEIMGKPSFEGIIGNDEGELFGESSVIIYESSDYELLFIGDIGSDIANQAYLDIRD